MAEIEAFEYVVLGGGVSGLGFAKRVAEHGKSVLVLEKEPVVGGLSRSIHYKDFYLDFCAHRFHTNNKALLKEVLELPGLHMERHIKKSRNFMFGKWIKYPFEVQDLLRAMPFSKSIPAGFSFLWNMVKKRFKKKEDLRSFEDWFVYIYGYKLYEVMAKQYTDQIWEQLNQYIKDFGTQHKYKFIFGSRGDGNLMYAEEQDNITSEVLTYVNERYQGKGK